VGPVDKRRPKPKRRRRSTSFGDLARDIFSIF
jgi:hypothetical protein